MIKSVVFILFISTKTENVYVCYFASSYYYDYRGPQLQVDEKSYLVHLTLTVRRLALDVRSWRLKSIPAL